MTTSRPCPHAAILGSGIVGLTTALQLLERGWRVVVYDRSVPAVATSSVAAAFWLPFKVAEDDRVRRWAIRTRERLETMAMDGIPGVFLVPLLVLPEDKGRWRGARAASAAELPADCARGTRLDVPRIETPAHLPWLRKEFLRQGGRVETREVHHLLELLAAHPLVVNCPGIGAHRLVADSSVYPIRGQVVRVARPPGLSDMILIQDLPASTTYIVPRRHDVILGGTAEAGNWSLEPESSTAQAILERCTALRPELAAVPVLEHRVGLRPGRCMVRLELEPQAGGRAVIHNYGHGGAGFTLAWACAEDAADLAEHWLRETAL